MSAESTVGTLLESAAVALAREGSRRLSMRDICDQAGVSRGTLYRYFVNKDDVLAALAEHLSTCLRLDLHSALAGVQGPSARISAAVSSLVTLPVRLPWAGALLRADAEFVLPFLVQELAGHVRLLDELLHDDLARIPAVVAGGLRTEEVAELLERLVLSSWLLPAVASRPLSDVLESLGVMQATDLGPRPGGPRVAQAARPLLR